MKPEVQIKAMALNAACVQKAGLQNVSPEDIIEAAKKFEEYLNGL